MHGMIIILTESASQGASFSGYAHNIEPTLSKTIETQLNEDRAHSRTIWKNPHQTTLFESNVDRRPKVCIAGQTVGFNRLTTVFLAFAVFRLAREMIHFNINTQVSRGISAGPQLNVRPFHLPSYRLNP